VDSSSASAACSTACAVTACTKAVTACTEAVTACTKAATITTGTAKATAARTSCAVSAEAVAATGSLHGPAPGTPGPRHNPGTSGTAEARRLSYTGHDAALASPRFHRAGEYRAQAHRSVADTWVTVTQAGDHWAQRAIEPAH